MNILAIETSSHILSVAVAVNGLVTYREIRAQDRAGSEQFLASVSALLREVCISPEDLDLVVAGTGPGMFTGTRLGVGVAQGIALSHEIPVVPMTSLAMLASQVMAEGVVLSLVDARMGEVYAAWWRLDSGGLKQVGDMQCIAPEQLVVPGDTAGAAVMTALGSGVDNSWGRLTAEVRSRFSDPLLARYPRATDAIAWVLCDPGVASIDPAFLAPSYVRDKVAMTVAERQGG